MNWLYARRYILKNTFISKRQIDQSLKYIEVVKMEENVTAWIDRKYRYVNVPNYLKNDNCKLIRHAHRLTTNSLLFQLFQNPTNFTVYLLAPGDNSPINSIQKLSHKPRDDLMDEGKLERGDGAFRVNFKRSEIGQKNWNKNWTLVTTDTSTANFSRTATDGSMHEAMNYWNGIDTKNCDKKSEDFCQCYMEKVFLFRFKYGQKPTIGKSVFSEKDGDFECNIEYLEKYDIFRKDFVNERQVLIMPYSFMWMGGLVFCEN